MLALLLLLALVLIIALYLYARLSVGICRSSSCLVGKTAIITGANSGIGYQTALNLASRGCRIIMADIADMEGSKQNIIKHTNNPNIFTKKIDLSSLKSVRSFAAEILENEDRLDILINNAGVGAAPGNRTQDDLNPEMQINYFGHFLLTHLLIDLLKKSAPSRIVFTTSALAFLNNLSLKNFNYDKTTEPEFAPGYQNLRIYANSKLAAMIAADVFAEKLRGSGVTANSIHPGLVSTTIFSKTFSVVKNTPLRTFVNFSLAFFSKDAWEGAQTLIYAAVSKKMENQTGKFLVDCEVGRKPRSACDSKFCQEIWKASERYVGLEPHERL